jgi:calcineurin-like phosphoesterase family protein
MIYFTSDLHLGHDQEFIWGARGFNSVAEMNEKIITRWNSRITKDDDVYVLGDLVMGGVENVELLKQLNGKIHIIYGNHDGPKKREAYAELENVVECGWANMIKYKKYNFYLSHYPTITDNEDIGEIVSPKECVINLFGHTHQFDDFYDTNDGYNFRMYHVGVDSHDCFPVPIDEVIEEIKMVFQKSKDKWNAYYGNN